MNKPPLFPSREAIRSEYYNAAVPYLLDDDNKVRLGISITNTAKLTNGLGQWQITYANATNPSLRTKSVITEKNLADAFLMSTLQAVYRDIPQSKLTPNDRVVLNLQERRTPTKAPVPLTRPVIVIGIAQYLRHTLNIHDEETPTRRAKPPRTRGVQIWQYIGNTPPASDADYSLLAVSSTSTYIVNFSSADAGKIAYYKCCWENTIGETGPWSAVFSAMIMGQ